MDALKQILLVEDSPEDIELTLNAFAQHNLAHKIAITHDGAEALDYLYRRGEFAERPEGNPVVILLDIKMPKVNGIEVLWQLKTDEQMRLIPVVILTSSREDRDLSECYRLGVNAYVVKPVQFADFIEAVKQISIFWAVINEPPPRSVKSMT